MNAREIGDAQCVYLSQSLAKKKKKDFTSSRLGTVREVTDDVTKIRNR